MKTDPPMKRSHKRSSEKAYGVSNMHQHCRASVDIIPLNEKYNPIVWVSFASSKDQFGQDAVQLTRKGKTEKITIFNQIKCLAIIL